MGKGVAEEYMFENLFVRRYRPLKTSSVVRQHRFDADLDPEPNFYFKADRDPTSNFTQLGETGKNMTFIHSSAH